MAVTDFKLIGQRTWKVSSKPAKRARKVFRARTDSVTDGADLVAEHVDCPKIGDPYSDDHPGLLCRDVDVDENSERVPGGAVFEVTVEYSTEDDSGGGSGGGGGSGENADGKPEADPTKREPVVRLGFVTSTETVYKHSDEVPIVEDAEGERINLDGPTGPGARSYGFFNNKYTLVNSAGQPTPLEEQIYDPYISATYNIATNDFATIWTKLIKWNNSINLDDFDIDYRGNRFPVKAGTAMLIIDSSEPGKENGIDYQAVTLQFRIREDGWSRKVLDQGTRAILGDVDTLAAGEVPPPLVDASGEPVSEPEKLNGLGQKLGAGERPRFIKFRIPKLLRFKPLLRVLSR